MDLIDELMNIDTYLDQAIDSLLEEGSVKCVEKCLYNLTYAFAELKTVINELRVAQELDKEEKGE